MVQNPEMVPILLVTSDPASAVLVASLEAFKVTPWLKLLKMTCQKCTNPQMERHWERSRAQVEHWQTGSKQMDVEEPVELNAFSVLIVTLCEQETPEHRRTAIFISTFLSFAISVSFLPST